MASEYLARRIAGMEWYHRIDLGQGLRTPGRDYDFMWNATMEFMDEVDFTGKRVLDIGCWDGLFSFYAERRGAGEVIATDLDPHATFDLAAEALQSKVRFQQCSAYRLHEAFAPETFDIVMFNGVLYHLMYPLAALVSIQRVMRETGTLLMESAFYNAEHERPFIFVSYGEDELYPGDPSSCTFPTPKAYRYMLNMTLFEVRRENPYHYAEKTGRILYEAQRRPLAKADRFYEYRYAV